MKPRVCVGVEVAKDELVVVAKDQDYHVLLGPKSYPNRPEGHDRLVAALEELRRRFSEVVDVGMEATGIYHLGSLDFLTTKGFRVRVFNPLELRGERLNRVRQTKTDKLDAGLIADLMIKEGPMFDAYEPEPEAKKLRELTRIRHRIVEAESIAKRQLHRNLDVLCAGYDAVFTDVTSPASLKVLDEGVKLTRFLEFGDGDLEAILRECYPTEDAEEKARKLRDLFSKNRVPETIRDPCIVETKLLVDRIELYERHLEQVERKIESAVERCQSKTRELLQSIPGIGPVTMAAVIGEVGDFRRFTSAKKLVAFAGLDPKVFQSGRFNGTGGISKRGSPSLRDAMYQAAFSSLRSNPVTKDHYDRMRAKGLVHKSALCACARVLLGIVYAVVRNGKPFYVPKTIVAKNQAVSKPA